MNNLTTLQPAPIFDVNGNEPTPAIVRELETKISIIASKDVSKFLTIDDEAQVKLLTPFDENVIEIRPDGLIYIPQTFIRKRLNDVFGVGQWQLYKENCTMINNVYCFEGSLFIRGCFVATAMGQMEYHENNSFQKLPDVYESAKSDCLVRCCKDLSIGNQCWQPEYTRVWVNQFAVKVWRKSKTQPVWRKKTTEPFYDEYIPGQRTFTQQETGLPKPNLPTLPPVGPTNNQNSSFRLTVPQVKRFWAIAKKNGLNDDSVHRQLMKMYNIASVDLLSKSQYEAMCGTDKQVGILSQINQ